MAASKSYNSGTVEDTMQSVCTKVGLFINKGVKDDSTQWDS